MASECRFVRLPVVPAPIQTANLAATTEKNPPENTGTFQNILTPGLREGPQSPNRLDGTWFSRLTIHGHRHSSYRCYHSGRLFEAIRHQSLVEHSIGFCRHTNGNLYLVGRRI